MAPKHDKITRIASDCPDCGRYLARKRTKDGREFISCSGYPACKFAESLDPHLQRIAAELEDVTRDRDELLHIINTGKPVE